MALTTDRQTPDGGTTHDAPDERGALLAAMNSALQEASASKAGFFVPIDDITQYFGDALVFDAAPARLSLQLRYRTESDFGKQRICNFFLGSGDWQEMLVEMSESFIMEEVSEIAANGKMPRRSRAYRRFGNRLDRGRPMVRNQVVLDSQGLIDEYIAATEQLVESIRNHGLLRHVRKDISVLQDIKTSRVRLLSSEVTERNIGVALGANGELYRVCAGNHRTAAALALGLQSMPVEVSLIHTDFLRKSMAQANCDAVAAILACVNYAKSNYSPPPGRREDRS